MSPYVLLYAQEFNRRLSLETEMCEIRQDLDRVIAHAESLKENNQLLQDQVDKLSKSESAESLLLSLQQENEALRAQLNSLNPSELIHKSYESGSLADDSTQPDDLEIENQRLQIRYLELQKTTKEDQKRIENLHMECGNLSAKLNEAMELMEKYKTGYMNMKRRNDVLDKPRVVIQQVDGLTKSSGYYKCCFLFALSSRRYRKGFEAVCC